ncbi:MAG: sulfotransferase family protein [Panacibacter sp.]
MSIKIIGAGLPRTGTNTLKGSLEILGYTKAYHMKELLVHPNDLHYWLTLKETGTTDWEKLYDGFQATVDFPAYPWYKEHMKQYPDAKVILTVRPFEKWYASVYSTIWTVGPKNKFQKIVKIIKMLLNSRLMKAAKCVKLAKTSIFAETMQGKFDDKAFAEKMYNKHTEDVKAYVPADKLLVYDVTEGWEPLCKFLNVPVPNEALPHLNKKEDFNGMLKELMKGKMA